jgi:hypothetical protein
MTITKDQGTTHVETISLSDDLDKRIALATVRLVEVLIRGVAVWRSRHGKLRVYFPSYRLGAGWDEAIYLPEELRTEVEADVIAAYKNAKAEAKKDQGQHPQDANVRLGRPRVQFHSRSFDFDARRVLRFAEVAFSLRLKARTDVAAAFSTRRRSVYGRSNRANPPTQP